MNIKKINWFKLLASIISTFIFASVGMLLGGSTEKYSTINLPVGAPPKIVFPIVWSVLYLILGIALYLIWCTVVSSDKETKLKKIAVLLYVVSMVLNAIYPLVFFRLDQYFAAFIIIIAMIVLAVASIAVMFKLNRISAYLLAPYLVWLAYAAYLNFEIFKLN